MNPHLKITRQLLELALQDLERPHPFAYERVGFFSCRQISDESNPILLCYDYHSIEDNDYIEDDEVGARINGKVIRDAMGRAISQDSAQLWVHTHGRKRSTTPSPVDRIGGADVLRSLVNAKSNRHHGWIVISESAVSGEIHIPKKAPLEVSDLTVVGMSMMMSRSGGSRHQVYRTHPNSDDRQGFLGREAPRVFAQSRIGIVGYGGGGSHVGQQLAHIGFKNVLVFDRDVFQESNLTRLVGSLDADVRDQTLKTRIAERTFTGIRPDSNFERYDNWWQENREELSRCDVVFSCVDRFERKRDLEYFCRSRMIPLIDIGMKVVQTDGSSPAIYGQVTLSMPGEICLRCLNVTTEKNLANEAADYGAGPQPQVVWPNGVLASTGVGIAVQLLTAWAGEDLPPLRLDYNGKLGSLTPAGILSSQASIRCSHFSHLDLGDPRLVSL